MVKGATCAAAAGLAVAVLVLLAGAAAEPRRAAGQTEAGRAQAAADASRARSDARRARSDARSAEAEIAGLESRSEQAQARGAEAKSLAEATTRRLRELGLEATQGRSAYVHDRRLIERLVIAASLASRSPAFDRSAAEVEAFVRAAGPAAVVRRRDRAAALVENRRLQAELKLALTLLGEARDAITEERRGIDVLVARQGAFRQARLAAALDAEHRARRLARQARTLRELTERVQPPRSASLPAPPLEKLRSPAPGTLVHAYGERMSGGREATGLTYRTQPAAVVVAPASGAIRYAGLFRSYGQILILALDNDYLLVLAGMESVGARAGELVAAGQPVGRMAVKPAPELYVEVRRNGRPINPTGRLAS